MTTSRTYCVASIAFRITMNHPFGFMVYSSVVQSRISSAAAGEAIKVLPCRAGDKTPPRSFIHSREELSPQTTPWDIDFSQYEPFLCSDDTEAVFELEIENGSTSYCDGGASLLMDVDSIAPAYHIYKKEGKTIFCFEGMDGVVREELEISEDFRKGRFHSLESKSANSFLYSLHSAIMMMFTYNSASKGVLLMHASTLLHNGRANMFLGSSGTGKSTHCRLWLENINDCCLINDDNPAIKVYPDGRAMVYGTPWSGKTACYRNTSAEIRAIVRLKQAPDNKATKVSGFGAYAGIIPSVSAIRWERKIMDNISTSVENLCSHTEFLLLECTPEKEAALCCVENISI